MALNKAQTSLGMKIILIFLIIAFVAGFIPLVGSLFSSPDGQTATTGVGSDAVSQANDRGRNAVAALNAQLQSDPASYTVLVALGNSYFDWANSIQQASQTASAAAGTDQPIWVAAKDAYSRALAVKKGESPVTVDYSIATFYAGDVDGAIKIAEQAAKDNPTFAPAPFNLGVFYAAKGDSGKAIAAYERYLKLDPEGKNGNVDFVKEQLTQLKSTPGSSVTTP